MHLNFRQGVVSYPQTGSYQAFLVSGAGSVSLRTGTAAVNVAFAHRDTDYLLVESVDVANAWGPLIPSTDCYLYWDINSRTTVRMFGFTVVEPVFGGDEPNNPVLDQHWFDTNVNVMRVYESSGWREVIRVFAAIVNNTTIIPLGSGFPSRPFAGSQVQLTENSAPGRIIHDEYGYPIRRKNGTFVTTEDVMFVDGSPINPIRLDGTIVVGTAFENMALHSIVRFDDFGELKLAEYDDLQDELIAILMEDLLYGESGTVALQGKVEDVTWNWSTVGAPLWVSTAGQLTEIDPHVSNAHIYTQAKAPIARVLTPTSIFFEQGLGGIGDTGRPGTGTGEGGGTSIQFRNEGDNLGDNAATIVDFTGTGVTATRASDTVTVNIANSQIQWQSEGNNLGNTNATSVNVAGNSISAARSGNTIIITSTDQRHNQLIDIQGGGVLERYHLTAAQVTNLDDAVAQLQTLNGQGGIATIGLISAIPWKYPVRVATTAALGYPFAGLLTVDNVSLAVDDRVLVKTQGGLSPDPTNGVWLVRSGNWVRDPVTLTTGSIFYVSEGSSNATQAFVLSTVGTIVVGTTPIRFTSFNNSQFITLSGDAAGSGTTSIPVTLTNSGVSPGLYTQVQVDVKGRAIAGFNPTTLAGYGITDALPRAGGTMTGFMTLNANPSSPLHAATKAYVDAATGGTGFTVNGGLSLVGTVLSVASASTSRIVINSNNIDLATIPSFTPGTYNSVAVDAYGRVTAGSTVGNSLITITGDVSGSGTSTIALSLPAITTAGTFTSVAVNTKGQVTAGSNPTTLSGYGITDAVARAGSTMTGALVMGTSDTVSASNNSITRVKDPVSPQDVATKHYVDTATGSVAYTAGNGISLAAGVISTNVSARFAYTTNVLDLSTTGVSPGTYTSLSVDAFGRVTAATNPTPVNQPITLSGDVSGSGTATITVSLVNSGVSAGSAYNKFSVNSKGIVTVATKETTFAGLGLVDGIDSLSDVTLTTLSASQVLSWNGSTWTNASPTVGADKFAAVRSTDTAPSYLNTKLDFSSAFTTSILNPSGDEKLHITLSSTGTSTGGPFNTFTVGADGRILTASNTSGSNQNIVVSGDASGSGTTAITLTLANVATAGTYKSVTVNSKGLVTAGTNPTTIAGYGITDAQPLSTFLTSAGSVGFGIVTKAPGGADGSIRIATLQGSAGRITITNPSAYNADPVFDLASGIISSPGIYTKVTVDTYGRVTAGSTITATDVGGLGTIAPQNSNAVTITGGSISGTSISPRINTPTYASSLTLNWANADVIRITLTGDITITNSGGVAGQKYLLEIKQGSGGGHTVTFTGETVFGTDLTGITLSTAAGLTDEIGFIYNEIGTSYRCVALTRGFAS